MKYRMVFCKQKEVAFVSHLELMKVFSQAIRRADLPLATTEGFNPRPKINFSSAIATGMTSQVECADLELMDKIPTEDIKNRLNKTLPPGFYIKAVKAIPDKTKSLMALLAYADYRVVAGYEDKLPIDIDWDQARDDFLAQDEIIITTLAKKKMRKKDIRPGIERMQVTASDKTISFKLELKSGSTGHVRPEHVVDAFLAKANLGKPLYVQMDKTMVYGLKDKNKLALFDLV